MSLLFNTHSRFLITFLPRIKHLLISWLQSAYTVILKPKKIKPVTVTTFSPSTCHELIGLGKMVLLFWKLNLVWSFLSLLSSSSRGSLVPLNFLALETYNLCILGCLYFPQQPRFHLVLHLAQYFK